MSNLTDEKITKRSKDRRRYWSPSNRETQCPYLSLDASGNPEIVQDEADPFTVRKVRRCVCTESAPMCSYHLGDGNTTGTGTKYFCHRYELMHEDPEKAPVDTHDRVLRIQDGELIWK